MISIQCAQDEIERGIMALTDENNMVMPVSPMYGNGGGFGDGFGGGGWWILLLFILLGNGGWGNGFGGFGGNDIYPWMNQSNQINSGFRDQMLGSQISGIQSAVTSGFGDVQMALCNGFAGVEQGANARQMANMNQAFAAQTAMSQGFNGLQSQLASCCCENRLASADLKYTIATENCADRAALSDALRDVIAANTASTQRILDQMCQDKIDAKNDRIAELERQLSMASLAASQTMQTQALIADNTAQTQYIVNRVAPYPIPAYVVANPTVAPTTNG